MSVISVTSELQGSRRVVSFVIYDSCFLHPAKISDVEWVKCSDEEEKHGKF